MSTNCNSVSASAAEDTPEHYTSITGTIEETSTCPEYYLKQSAMHRPVYIKKKQRKTGTLR